MIKYHIIKTLNAFMDEIRDGSLRNAVVKGLDLTTAKVDWNKINVQNASFFGCQLHSLDEEYELRKRGAHVVPPISGLPYDPFRATLYTPEELMEGWDPDDAKNNSLDKRIERHFEEHGGHDPDIVEALAQAIHDYSIDNATKDLLGVDPDSHLPIRKAVGIMGGHLARRDDPDYIRTVNLAARLTQEGFFVICGGGPGVMEAANLGAYLAFEGEAAIAEALSILQAVPEYAYADGKLDPGYILQAQAVLKRYPHGAESLAVPTWFYGHEPVNMFATNIAKYFSNSLREDGLLALSVYGIVFAPGSAATTQEVFADAAQNHYGTFDYYSPMVFMGTSHYLQNQVYTALTQQAAGHEYASMISIFDDIPKVIEFIKHRPPVPSRLYG